MGTDRKSHRKSRDTRISKVNRSLAVGAVAGATAIGFSALSSVAAPTANADWWEILTNNGNDNGHNRAASDNNTLFGAINGNGNPTQQAWGTGNNINNQRNRLSPVIGGIAANLGATAAIGGSSIAADIPIAAGNGNNGGLTAGANTAPALGTNVGAALAAALGGTDLGAQIPVTLPILLGVAVPIEFQTQDGCVAVIGDCNNDGGNAIADGATQSNGTLSTTTQTQNSGDATADATNTQTANGNASANGNTTQTNQTGGVTTVTGSAESGTAGNAEATTDTSATAAGNLADNTLEVNTATGNGNNSTNSVGNHNNSSNTNSAGDNSGVLALAAPAADDPLWEILTGNGNDNGHNSFVADNNTLIGVINGNGNSTQQAWGAGNAINNQLNLLSPVIGGVGVNVGATAALGGSSIAADAPIALANGNNIGVTAAANTAAALATNLGAALAPALGGSNLGAQIPVTLPVLLGVAVPVDVQAQVGCGAVIGSCDNTGGNPHASGAAQSNGTLNAASQTQNAGDATANATNTQTANANANADANTTQTNQTGGDTTVTASAESGTAGNAEAITDVIAIVAGNLADNTFEANIATGNGNNSTNSVGNHNNSGNTNSAGDNSGFFALAAPAAASADPLWEILTGNGNDNGHNTFLADNNTLIGVINGNGNSTQQAWGAGNVINNQRNLLSPVVGGLAVNAAVTAAVGGSSIAADAPIGAANGNNVGGTIGLNTAADLSTNAGGALGAALGGSILGVQAPVTAPVNVGVAVPVNAQTQAICVAGGGCDNTGHNPQAGGATQENPGPLSQTTENQTAGNADAEVIEDQVASSTSTASGNTTQTNQTGGRTTVHGTATSHTGGNTSVKTKTTGTAGGNISRNTSTTNKSTDNGSGSTNSVGNNNDSSNSGSAGNN